jgi:hypothetical protein
MNKLSAEQRARDMLENMGIENAQTMTAGELVELANLIADSDFLKSRKNSVGRCGTCKHRNEQGCCRSQKLADNNELSTLSLGAGSDVLIYQFPEGGEFIVGENFGCVHHEQKRNTNDN